MAQTNQTDYTYVASGSPDFLVPFPYLSTSEVEVTVDGTPTGVIWTALNSIQLTPTPAVGAAVRIRRNTDARGVRNDFSAGAPFSPRNINENNEQLLYAVEEAVNDTSGTAAAALVQAGQAVVTADAAAGRIDAAVALIDDALQDSALYLRNDLANATDPAKGAGMVGWGAGVSLRTKVSKDFPSILDYSGHDITGNNDTTAALQAFLDDYKDLVQSGSVSYKGGITANLPKGVLAVSSRIKLWSLIQLSGAGPFSTVIKASDLWADGEYLVSASPELDGYGTIRPAVGMKNLGFDHNNTGARGFIGHALNDNCLFTNIRSFNFRKNVVTLDRGAGGATVSQGWTFRDWHAITAHDIEEDVFVTKEANEGIFMACKALGLSTGTSAAVGFHIGDGAISEGVHVFGSSVAHLPNGTGVRLNHVRDCWTNNSTFENLLRDVHIGHASDALLCSKAKATGNRHYQTVGAPAGQRDIYIDRAISAGVDARENAAIEITANALNCEARIPTNRTSGATIPATVTLSSTSSVVHETHKNGAAIHHTNGSLSFEASASGQFDVKLPGGGYVRGDSFWTSMIAASGKGARILSNGGTASVNSTGDVTLSSASGRPVTIQENGVSKIQLDGSGRIRMFGMTTTPPVVAAALYKDASGFVKIS